MTEQNKHLAIRIKNLKIKMLCEYCAGSINSKPKVLEFANFQQFFCFSGCRNNYREKYAVMIQSIIGHLREMKK
jgi:hypothetical protein